MKHQADAQRFIDFSHKLFVYPAHVILQSLFIDRPNLLQKDNRILDDSVPFASISTCVGSFALFILEVIAAQITVGLCRFPTSFWMTRTGRTPPCSEPTTGLKSA